MTLPGRKFCVAGILLAVAASLATANDYAASASPDTQRILGKIERGAPQRTQADRKAAEELNREGDQAYRKGDYRSAFTAYSNSYPNYPTSHAYILAGDARWRDVLQYAKAPHASSPHACAIENQHFSHDLLLDVEQHHDVGLALAVRANGGRLPADPFLQRARDSAECLRALARRYNIEPPTACVDLVAVQQCLGDPLL